MTQLITTNNQQHVSNVNDDVGITLLHLSPNVITLRSLLHLRPNVITLRSLLHLRPNVITLRSLLHLRAVITFRSSTDPRSMDHPCGHGPWTPSWTRSPMDHPLFCKVTSREFCGRKREAILAIIWTI